MNIASGATETTDSTLPELKPIPKPVHGEEPEKDEPNSDIVWTRIPGDPHGRLLIFDQDNMDGTRLISMIGKSTSRI